MLSLSYVFQNLFKSFSLNIIIFFSTLLFALPLGLIMCLLRMSRFSLLRGLTYIFIWLVRGTPLMLQLFIVFYVPGLCFGKPFRSRLLAVLIAFIINYSAYFAEIYRGAIASIPKGQYEAAKVLGISKKDAFFRVILFQLVKKIVTPMSNEVITLVKDTSLARVVAVPEILMKASEYASKGYIWPVFSTGLFFLSANGILTICFDKLERRLRHASGE